MSSKIEIYKWKIYVFKERLFVLFAEVAKTILSVEWEVFHVCVDFKRKFDCLETSPENKYAHFRRVLRDTSNIFFISPSFFHFTSRMNGFAGRKWQPAELNGR
jgi:hypothetical protein